MEILNIEQSSFKQVWFTSDLHLGDTRLDLFGRSNVFSSSEEMDNIIIRNWNKKINNEDLVIVVGDVALTEEGFNKLENCNGTKWLIRGNYDDIKQTAKFDPTHLIDKYFDEVYDVLLVKTENELFFVNHFPSKAIPNLFNIVGHIHGLWKVQRNMINVGIDAWHFNPVSINEILFNVNGVKKYYDENVFAGELISNIDSTNVHKYVKEIQAPIYNNLVDRNDINLFLAGPIQGATNWRKYIIDAIKKEFKHTKLTKNIIIANPNRDILKADIFNYNEQVSWESYYINKALKLNGIILFYCPIEAEKDNFRSYAQTTRFELGEVFGKINKNTNFIIGVEPNFHGRKYIEYKFKSKYNYNILDNIKSVTNKLIDEIKIQLEY